MIGRTLSKLALGGAVALALVWPVPSGTLGAAPEDGIQDAAVRVSRAVDALGEARAEERLARLFRVAPRVVAELYEQKLDFGEVAVVLALAEAGQTSSDRILVLWASDRLHWSQIAQRLRVDLPVLLKRLEGVRRDLVSSR